MCFFSQSRRRDTRRVTLTYAVNQYQIFGGMIAMIFTRIGAAIFVLLLIGSLAFAGVAVAAWLGPMSAHGTNVIHVAVTLSMWDLARTLCWRQLLARKWPLCAVPTAGRL